MTTIKNSTGLALEAAVVADPDDLAAHMAFADWLSEQIDPALQSRGEFARVQIDLADPKRSKGRKKALEKREQELIEKHEHEWLGDKLFARLDDPNHRCTREYENGWLSRLDFEEITTAQAKAVAASPCLRLLRSLDVSAEKADKSLAALAQSPHLGNVRALTLYIWTGPVPIAALVARMPLLADLNVTGNGIDPTPALTFPLPHLKELRLQDVARYPAREIAANASLRNLDNLTLIPVLLTDDAPADIELDDIQALARSPHLAGLTWLTIHRTNMGDDGVRELIDSGLLARLEALDLSHGCVTDAGARMLAGCPASRKLYSLQLVANRLTDAGVNALNRLTKVNVSAYGQHEPDDDGRYPDDDYHASLREDESLRDDEWE